MLNLEAYRLLSTPDRFGDGGLQFFLWLITAYDLTSWKSLNLRVIIKARPYMVDGRAVGRILNTLVAAGLLETGIRGKGVIIYRINPAYLLTAEALREWFSELAAREQRESLLKGLRP